MRLLEECMYPGEAGEGQRIERTEGAMLENDLKTDEFVLCTTTKYDKAMCGVISTMSLENSRSSFLFSQRNENSACIFREGK